MVLPKVVFTILLQADCVYTAVAGLFSIHAVVYPSLNMRILFLSRAKGVVVRREEMGQWGKSVDYIYDHISKWRRSLGTEES